MVSNKQSESITENIFREFYGVSVFIEKSAIPKSYGFTSKKGTTEDGYPDFFKELKDFVIVVEAKALHHSQAEKEVKFYMQNNSSHHRYKHFGLYLCLIYLINTNLSKIAKNNTY